jgi:hypothetical protein
VTRQTLRIGDITIAIDCDETFAVLDPSTRFLVSSDATPDVALDVRRGAPAAPQGDLIFDSGGVWRLRCDGDRNVYSFHSPAFRSDPYKTATFDAAYTRGEVVCSDEVQRGADPLEYPLDELLLGAILGAGKGVELHGVGIVDQGRGYLFVGQSGAGKTTTARLWLAEKKDITILSDDRVIVRESHGALRMYGTPWHGEAEICAAADAPLEAIYILEQSAKSEVRDVDESDAVARLFACSFPLFYRSESIAFTIAFLARVVSRKVVHVLAFAPDASAVSAIFAPS